MEAAAHFNQPPWGYELQSLITGLKSYLSTEADRLLDAAKMTEDGIQEVGYTTGVPILSAGATSSLKGPEHDDVPQGEHRRD